MLKADVGTRIRNDWISFYDKKVFGIIDPVEFHLELNLCNKKHHHYFCIRKVQIIYHHKLNNNAWI